MPLPTRALLLTVTRRLLAVAGALPLPTRALLLTVTRRLATAGVDITILVAVTLIVVAVLVALLVVVLSIPHHGGMGDDARAETDGEDCRGSSCNGGALSPRGFLRRRRTCLSASCHRLVARLIVGRRLRDRLQGRTSKRIAGLLLGDGRHLHRFRLRCMGGQYLGLLRDLRLRLGQDRGALGVTCQVLVVVRHGDAPFC